MKRKNLKVAIVGSGWKHQTLAARVNVSLPADEQVSEHVITQFVTCRKNPTPLQAAALAAVLDQSVRKLFARDEEEQP